MPETDATGRARLSPKAVTWFGMAINAVLAVGKVSVGWLFASQAILADGFHSASDLITDLAVLAGLGASEREADGTHPYGHRRISTLVAMFVGAGLLGVAVMIAWRAVVAIPRDHAPMRSPLPLALAVATIPVKELLYRLTRHVGRRTANVSLIANAWHHRSDAFTSIAAAVGLTVVAVGGRQWAFVDELTALVLAAFLGTAAVGILRKSAAELIDRAPSAETLAVIEQAVGRTDGVRSFRARQVGGKVAKDVHVHVDPELTVREGHDIASAVQQSVQQADRNVLEVVVHVEPCEGDDCEGGG